VFPYLPAGTYDVVFSKFGYQDYVAEDVVITDGGTTTVDAILTERSQHTLEGVVEGNDGLLIADAEVLLQGYADYSTLTNEVGAFLLEDVWAGNYTLSIIAEGYDLFVMEDVVIENDLDLNTLVITKTIGFPGALSIDMELEGEGDALFSWHLGFDKEFRYDDGVAANQLGASNGTQNSILGSVHRNKATLYEMSWFLTEMGGPHTHIAVWVFGLDQNGLPDRHNILYSMGNVPNIDNQWNTYEFTTPVEAPNGFLIGVSYTGFVALGTDSGDDEEWPFVENTHYVTTNFNTTAFSPIESFGFEHNFTLRAFGRDYEELAFDLKAETEQAYAAEAALDFTLTPLAVPLQTGEPTYTSAPASFATKDLIGFRVFLNDMDTPVEENVTEMHYLFEGLAEGDYVAGVQSVYPTGTSEVVTLGF
ncbi:MAG: carboxypeptidase-like regulatory domain-containing protein, partial [Bacteroidales bacterium]|nr:carboxypeptidase-like regulatory domain-containing protein [Bacteroidales bacterium]